MGFLDFLKRKKKEPEKMGPEMLQVDLPTPVGIPQDSKPLSEPGASAASAVPPVPEEEKKYYQPDEYYTEKSHEGTMFEKAVVTFEERKKISIPSSGGLYVAEILLLDYCSKGKYPHPKGGYPGFWWFAYGIRNVGAALKSLEERGFLTYGPAHDALKGFTVAELKTLLQQKGAPVSGKKADLIERVMKNFSKEELLAAGMERKYVLTEKGRVELDENAYVPYMHRYPYKTVEGCENEFNVWSVNRILGIGDKSNWKAAVDELERKYNEKLDENHDSFMKELKKCDPEGYNTLRTQDQQIRAVQKQADIYYKTDDIDSYIAFWEGLWKNGGLKFEGSGWHFTLPDLYIKTKQYDKALQFLDYMKCKKPSYADKAMKYIERVQKLKDKAENKKE